MRWSASIACLLFLSGLVKAGDWEDTGKGGRWLVRRKRAAEEQEELVRRKRDAEQDEDGEDVPHEDGLFDFLTSSEGEVVPKEKYTELEEKIPGLNGKDGLYKSPADGEWKKVKSISKVPIKKNKKPES